VKAKTKSQEKNKLDFMSHPSTTKTISTLFHEGGKELEFNAIRLRLASPRDILRWSRGEVTKPETINYRTQKPEKDGLFCERIFGPTKDWECYCGKYKKIRYKGIICDKCGVEVTRSFVRRERMGHISLAAPVAHIWFLRGIPSRVGLMLDMSAQELEKVVYFANFIITDVDEPQKAELISQIDGEFKGRQKSIEAETRQAIDNLNKEKAKVFIDLDKNSAKYKKLADDFTSREAIILENKTKKVKELEKAVKIAKRELEDLAVKQVISEHTYQDLSLKYGHIFEAYIGAEAIHKLLSAIDLDGMVNDLEKEVIESHGAKRKKIHRRLQLVKSLIRNHIRPEDMVLTVVPVIPPDLRPMVPLDGGRFATSDLNDLYRRVINRNNRLKRLIDLNAPEVIQRNEKRMLQEAVDALIDNSARHGKTVTASTGQKRQLKSIADMLKGKQGRFRQNLLGKRVDYSGRSVIVAGSHLQINQCGIPKMMALELFKPFVISRLIKQEYVHNVRSANRYIEAGHAEVWDILEDITNHSHVMLNRAPTLHRLGIQAFQPVLIEGKAIQLHPLVCTAFNADFDGDQMAVHVPLTEEAKKEAAEMMLSAQNLLKPATGDPVVTPNQDIVWGAYYMTYIDGNYDEKKVKYYASTAEAKMAYDFGKIGLRAPVKIKIDDKFVITSVGRVLFNEVMPTGLPFINQLVDKKVIRGIVSDIIDSYGFTVAAKAFDDIKNLAFNYITLSGWSWGMDDLNITSEKAEILQEAELQVKQIFSQYEQGLLTNDERREKVIDVWTEVKNKITVASKKVIDINGSVSSMIESGARGSWGQLTQIVGMKGLVINPAGDIIELPVKSNFKEGFDVLEYFISTHGARKGLSDTALRTANAGYLTRRLIDVAQDIVVQEEDCGDEQGTLLTKEDSENMGENIANRLFGRVVLENIKDKTGKIIVKKGEAVGKAQVKEIMNLNLDKITIRSVYSCRSLHGICAKCYGFDLAYNQPVKIGAAVGIMAAQSIGEPGTQLTMRTFHTGGVAGESDVTQGLPRVEEIFEGRNPKKKAFMSDVRGKVKIERQPKQRVVRVTFDEPQVVTYKLEDFQNVKLRVKDKDEVSAGDTVLVSSDRKVKADFSGQVKVSKEEVILVGDKGSVKEWIIPNTYNLVVEDGQLINIGDAITEGSLDLHDLYRLKGKEAVQKYILKEIQFIYTSQGQNLNDKHIEIIIRQMFSRIIVKDPGDTNLLTGEVVESWVFRQANSNLKKGKTPAKGEELLLGITKSSLTVESWLSAASFQETARVLISAAITGQVDYLRGLKENVIIGRLIPAGTGFGKYAKPKRIE